MYIIHPEIKFYRLIFFYFFAAEQKENFNGSLILPRITKIFQCEASCLQHNFRLSQFVHPKLI
jgi:hypothetical protein